MLKIPDWGNPIVESTKIVSDPDGASSTTYVLYVGMKVPDIDPFGFKLFEYPENILIL